MVGMNFLYKRCDFGDKVLKHEHNIVSFLKHNLLVLENFILFFIFFFVFAFEQLKIGLLFDFISFHFFDLLAYSDKSLLLRVDKLFFCLDWVLHVVIFVSFQFHLWNRKTVLNAVLVRDERVKINLAPGNTQFRVDSQAALNEVFGFFAYIDLRQVLYFSLLNFASDFVVRLPVERVSAVKHLVVNYSNRPYICIHSVRLAIKNFRSHCEPSS